jgi:hypothetical protein
MTYCPVAVLGFAARDEEEATQTVEALLDDLDSGFDDSVTLQGLPGGGAPAAVERFNTRLTYRYRDANNWQEVEGVVLAGEPTSDQLAALRAGLDEHFWFIPSQVGLVDLQERLPQWDSAEEVAENEADPASDPDHPWHELNATVGEDLQLTAQPPSLAALKASGPAARMTISELAEAIATQRWDSSIPLR